jgi:hypothetical protein
MRIADNTLFHHMAPATDDTLAHDAVLHTASVISMLLLLGIAVAFGAAGRESRRRLLPLSALIVLIAFLLTPLSLPLWNHLPELRFLQFPWRLTAILGSILALSAGVAFDRLKLNTLWTTGAALALAATLILPAWHFFQQPCDDEDTVQARVVLYHSPAGTDPTDEYTPASADNDALKHTNPPFWLGGPVSSCDQTVTLAAAGQAPSHLTLDMLSPKLLVLNRRDFPIWQVKVNGAVATSCGRDDGLIAVVVPAGHDVIDLTEKVTPDEIAGFILSLISALALTGVGLRQKPS